VTRYGETREAYSILALKSVKNMAWEISPACKDNNKTKNKYRMMNVRTGISWLT
jgi:hypothetical protein